ncbi:conserved protein of unknown function [Candidatus Promineifilum breve]|uniref:Virulence factor domain-containing protein n=1 Tax=Candidatus Promineifilum breve TaxID=1806508 RepID=A0A160T1S7_9CHLR|nr:virulence factor [Candidatus Promineifilum breve]CUS02350.2 conserved protein of unknown function [Candidatus Promineifilum breve]
MTTYQIMSWHDIPVQVRAGGRRDRVSLQLDPRFMAAVDSAAMAAGLTGSDAYLAGFVWGEAQERDGAPEAVAAAVAAELEDQFATIDWRATAVALRSSTEN